MPTLFTVLDVWSPHYIVAVFIRDHDQQNPWRTLLTDVFLLCQQHRDALTAQPQLCKEQKATDQASSQVSHRLLHTWMEGSRSFFGQVLLYNVFSYVDLG